MLTDMNSSSGQRQQGWLWITYRRIIWIGPQPERYLFLSEYQHQLFQHDLQGNDRRDIYGGSDPDKDGESQETSGEYHDEKL